MDIHRVYGQTNSYALIYLFRLCKKHNLRYHSLFITNTLFIWDLSY